MEDNYEEIDDSELLDSDDYSDINVPQEDEFGGDYSQANQPKFGQEQYERKHGDKDYYKNKQSELDELKKEAEARKKETEANRQIENEARKSAKKEKNADDGKENYKARKDDYKKAKAEDKAANKELKNAKRNSFNNKLDNFSSNAYQTMHPGEALKSKLREKYDPREKLKNKFNNAKDAVKDKAKEAAKEGAKKAGKAAAKGAKKAGQAAGKAVSTGVSKLASLLASIPPQAWLVIGIIVLVIAIIVVVVAVVAGTVASVDSSGITAASVNYNINGVNSETQIKITKADGELLTTVSLEKYIAGVALLQVGTDYNQEVLKAQIVMVRSYLLAKGVSDPSNNYIYVVNDDSELVYWDYTTNLFRKESDTVPGTYIYSPEYVPEDASITPYKTALTADEITAFETIVASVMGQYVVDSSGNPINLLVKNDIASMNQKASENVGTDNGTYSAILTQLYPAISKTESAEYEMIYYGEVGEFSTWKQKTKLGAPWGDVLLGTTATIDNVGCLVTSISMQIAYSGVTTGTITDFNPGTFATAARKQGCFSSGGAINSYACLQKVVPNFQYSGQLGLSGSNQERYNTVKSYAEKGYFIVIEVRTHGGGQHWVALDVVNSAAVSWKDLYIWDPATTKTKISDKITYKANKITYFKAIK